MRIIVDETLCEANGFCESLAPDIFEIGQSDVAHVVDGEVPEDRYIDVQAAVDQCPKAALRLVD
jgi:ferredoxin